MAPRLKSIAAVCLRRFRAIFVVTVALISLFGMLPEGWSTTPTFTVANNIFAPTTLGQSLTQNVTVTLNTAVPIQSIGLGTGLSEYKLGTVAGCTVDGKTVNAAGTICTLPVTFTPIATGSTASPATARTAQLLVTDVESGNAVVYAFGLLGAATGPIMQFTPATLTRVAGAAATGYPTGDQGLAETTSGYSGDGGQATSATFAFLNLFNVIQEPTQPMAVDSSGDIYVIDFGNYIIRRIDGTTGTVTTVAGTPKSFGRTGDGGQATSAKLEAPGSLALDAADNIYFSDAGTASTQGGYTIRMVNAGTGIISSIAGQNLVLPYAGTGTCVQSGQGYSWEPTCGDGGLATDAFIYEPQAIAIDSTGNIFILEEQGTIRRIDAVTGIITSIGNTVPSGNGIGYGMAMGADGNLYASVYDSTGGNDYLTQTGPTSGVTKIVGGGATTLSATACTKQGSIFTDWSLGFNSGFAAGLSADGAGNIYGETGECNSSGGEALEGQFRFNIASGLASFYTSGTGSGNGTTNGVYESFEGAYGVEPAFAVADGAGNIYFQTFNQIAKLVGSQGSLYGYTSRFDFQTDSAGTTCASDLYYCQTAVISNVGNEALDTTFTLSPGFSYLTTGDTTACANGTLTPGEFCNLDIEFTPLTVGTVNGTLTATDNAATQGAGQQVLALNGVGVAASQIGFAPPAINFGTVAVNTTSPAQTVTISNPGTASLTLDGIFPFGPDASEFTITGGTCPTSSGSVAAGGSCTVLVAFAPTSTGTFSAYLNVNNTAENSSGSLQATSFMGTAVASITATPTPVISPAAGTYNAPVAVQITDSGASPTIYDTTDGTTPTTSLAPYSAPFTVGAGTTQVQAIATSTGDGTSATASSTYTVQPYLAFNSAAVGITSATAQQLTASVSLLSTTAPTASLHYGTDYALGKLTCAPNGAIEVCTVPVSFVPTLPGPRKDALFLKNGSTILATVELGGTGLAPLSLVQPGLVTSPIQNGTNYIYGSAVDENDTVYYVTGGANTVHSFTKAGVDTALTIAGLKGDTSIAIDGAGTLYITQGDYSPNLVTYNTVTGVSGTISMAPPAPYQPCSNSNGGSLEGLYSVAVDDLGNIYALETLCNNILELKTDGTFVVTPIDPSITQPSDLAVDAAGNIFVSGYTINEIPSSGTQTEVNTIGASAGLAVDAADTLYATRYSGLNGVAELPASDYSTAFASLDAGSPLGESLASDGTLFVGNYNDLDKVDRSQGAIAFGEQYANVASTPQNVSIYNGGNQPLSLTSFAIAGTGFSLGTPASNACTKGLSIPAGGYCQFAVILTAPNAGTYSGALSITTNSLTVATTQTVALSGYVLGIYVVEAPNPLNFGTVNVGSTSAPQTVTFTNNGDLYDASIGSPNYSVSGYNVNIGTCTSSIAPGASCAMTVTFAPTASGPDNGTISFTAGSNGGSQTQTIVIDVNGTGAAQLPLADLSPATLAFGGVVTGATRQLSATLSNPGAAALNISSISITGTNTADFAIGTGTNACGTSLAAGASCPIYVTFTPASAAAFTATLSVADNATPTPQTATLTGTGLSFVSNVGTALAAQAVTVNIATAGTLGSIQVLTQGAANLDFTSATGGTCATGTAYTVGETCTVNVIFDPHFAGARRGAVLLTDAGGNVLGTTYLPGTGFGPQLAFGPGKSSTVLSSSQYAIGSVTFDALGNLYFRDGNTLNLLEIPLTGSTYGTPTIIATGFSYEGDIALDGAGNIFTADYKSLKELAWNGTSYAAPKVVPNLGNTNQPNGLAIDGMGNIFFSDQQLGAVFELPLVGGEYGNPQQLAFPDSGGGNVFYEGVAVDSSGSVYAAEDSYDLSKEQLVKLPLSGGGWGTPVVVASGLASPIGIAVDAAGDVYASNFYLYDNGTVEGNSYTDSVIRVPWNGSSYGTPVILPIAGISNLTDMAMDSQGTIVVATTNTKVASILKLDRMDPPSLTFADTSVGLTSTDSPQTVTVTNIGNAGLYFTAQNNNPVYPLNFPINNNDNNLCSEDSTVPQGQSCDVSVNFTPTAGGTLTGNVVLTDNNLNGTLVTQSIAVSGVGVQVQAATPVITPASGTYNSNVSVTMSDSTSGATIYYTTDGSTPTASSTKYTAPFTVSQTGTTVKAIAVAAGYTNSAVASAVYTLQAVTPVLNPPGGTYNGSQSVAITTTTAGASIYYTTNGVAPTTGSTLYTGPVTVSVSGTNLQAIAALSGYENSPVASGTYTIQTPAVTLAPTTLGFGNQTDGTTSAAMTSTLTNSGTAPLTITAITLTGANPGSFSESDNCVSSSPLATKATCTISVKFSPSAAQADSAFVTIADDASNSPQQVALSGTGTPPPAPVAMLTPSTLTFTAVSGTTSAAQTVTLSNTGNAPLAIGSVTIGGSNPSDFNQTNNCGSSLLAGLNCTISVTFSPASATSFSATLSVADNAAGSPQSTTLSGTGAPPPSFTVAASPAMQTVQPGATATYTITVTAQNGTFSNPVTLAASGLPTGATGVFSPPSVTPGSTSTTSQLSIQTGSTMSATTRSAWPLAAILPFLGIFFAIRRARRRWLSMAVLLLASLGAAAALSGCGGGFALPTAPPQTYTVTVTGNSGDETQTTTVQLTVQ